MATCAPISLVACSREARHRVLTFLYDGVPPLDADITPIPVEIPPDPDVETGPPGAAGPAGRRVYNHPAYQRNLCNTCHATESGGVLKTARQGLCQTCHPDKPPRKEFVHGPVAVNGCLACHHYHRAPYPKVLIADAQSLCFTCHVMEELSTDEHHATIEEHRCIACHDAHGGDDRYFLLPGVAEDGPQEKTLMLEREQ
jgi:predicted CXXCH cytochrome family protein